MTFSGHLHPANKKKVSKPLQGISRFAVTLFLLEFQLQHPDQVLVELFVTALFTELLAAYQTGAFGLTIVA